MTTDGARNEHGAAVLTVNDGNEIHCVDHNVQLVQADALNSNQAHPPPLTQEARAVNDKSHALVVFINGHKAILARFRELADAKRNSPEGLNNWECLVLDNDTRWDSKLGKFERVVYFDNEILALQVEFAATFPRDCLLVRWEFDLAYGMVKVLTPFRVFTKFFESRSIVTLAHVPHKVDELLSSLAPGSYTQVMQGRDERALDHLENLQATMAASINERFAWVFEEDSIALEALYLMPGPNRFTFDNFVLAPNVLESVQNRLLDDVVDLLPPDMPQPIKAQHRDVARAMLVLARTLLDGLPDTADPLVEWPKLTVLAPLFPLAQMLFGIPASTSDDERTFSGAGLVLGNLRTRMDLDNFRREQRVRQFLTLGTDPHTSSGRAERLSRSNRIIERFAMTLERVREEINRNDVGNQ